MDGPLLCAPLPHYLRSTLIHSHSIKSLPTLEHPSHSRVHSAHSRCAHAPSTSAAVQSLQARAIACLPPCKVLQHRPNGFGSGRRLRAADAWKRGTAHCCCTTCRLVDARQPRATRVCVCTRCCSVGMDRDPMTSTRVRGSTPRTRDELPSQNTIPISEWGGGAWGGGGRPWSGDPWSACGRAAAPV